MENLLEEKTAVSSKFGDDEPKWRPFFRQVIVYFFNRFQTNSGGHEVYAYIYFIGYENLFTSNISFFYNYVTLLIASSLWAIYFSVGVVTGSPTVIIPQLRREANSTAAVSEEMASWLSSAVGYSSIPWVFILPNLIRVIGRKKTIIIVSLSCLPAFLAFYFSTTPTHLLISEIFFGVPFASIVTINVLIISEYSSPKYRGLFLTIKSASVFWGIWVSNAIGTYTHWSYIPMFGFVCTLYSLTVLFWPESPYWLASKKRFVECRKAHRWLKGRGEKSEAELEQLIKSYSNHVAEISLTNLKFITKREFYIPLTLCLLTAAQYHFSGKIVFTVYAIEVMKKIMGDEKTAYRSMLILDGVTVFSTYIGCLVIKVLKRRTVLLTSSGIAITFLFIMSLYLYLINLSIITENTYLSLFFLAGFSMSINCGPMIMATSLYGELIPIRFKNICIIIVGIIYLVLHGTLLKVSPLIFKTFSMPGTFLFFGIASSVCAILMYIYLPETKDKTLLEIEEYFKDYLTVEENKKIVRSTAN